VKAWRETFVAIVAWGVLRTRNRCIVWLTVILREQCSAQNDGELSRIAS
jgi:hypothetical protein